MKLIAARYDDICMTCTGKIKPGDLIFWEKKNSHHAKCKSSVIGRWAGGQ
jgi:hypothetical protein